MLRKIVIFILLFSMVTPCYAVDTEVLDVREFSSLMKEFDNELLDQDYEEIIEDITRGDFKFDYKKIFGKVGKFLIKELRSNIGLAVQVILIALIIGLLDNLKSSFSSEGVSQIAFYVCYVLLVTLLFASFTNLYNIAKDFIEEISSFMNVLIPIIVGLIASTGGIATTTVIYPVIAFFSQFITLFVSKLSKASSKILLVEA